MELDDDEDDDDDGAVLGDRDEENIDCMGVWTSLSPPEKGEGMGAEEVSMGLRSGEAPL